MERTRAWFEAYNRMMAARAEIIRLSDELRRKRDEREGNA